MTQSSATIPPNDTIEFIQDLASIGGFELLAINGIRADNNTCRCFAGASCKCPGKHPNGQLCTKGVNSRSRNPGDIKDWFRRGNGNWGIATGVPHPQGGYLCVIDLDPRNGGFETLEELEEKYGKLPSTVTAVTGGSGAHYYFLSPFPVACRTIGPGIDLKGSGGYVVSEPSRHASGGKYYFEANYHPLDPESKLAQLPDWVQEGTTRDKERPQWDGDKTGRHTFLGEGFFQAGWLGKPVSNSSGAVMSKCPWSHEHSTDSGKGEDSSCVILPAIAGTSYGSFVCSHSHCNHRTYVDVVKMLPLAALAAARKKYPFKPKLVTPGDVEIIPAGEMPARAMPELPPGMQLKNGHNGGLALDSVNINAIITYDTRWHIDGECLLRFDEFSQQVKFIKQPPWHPDDAPSTFVDYWRDEDCARLSSWCSRNYNTVFSEDMLYKTMQMVARRKTVHPVREWLNTLVWDGVPRIATWCSRYLGAQQTEYLANVGKWWLVAGVARAFQPGCKVDNVLILEGGQGIRKSTALRTLVPVNDWFSDTPIDIGSKDSYMAMRGKFVIEMAELSSLTKADSSRAKAFFSSSTDTYRAPYGREVINVPRQCIYAGSVNHGAYLKDETGGRRYWPVACGAIDIESLRRDRDQLWSEAVHLYAQQGSKWYPSTPEENALCETEQSRRSEEETWVAPIAAWLQCKEAKDILNERDTMNHVGGYLSTGDILQRALKIPADRWDRYSQMRVGAAMAQLGWGRSRVQTVYVYTAPK